MNSVSEIAASRVGTQLALLYMAGEPDKQLARTKSMFRAEIRQLTIGPTLKMEGRLIGDWAEQAKSLVTKDLVPKRLTVDLTDVTYVDSVGEQVLKWFQSVGAAFMAKGVYAAGVCERLHLPLFDKVPRPSRPRSTETDQKAPVG